MAGSSCVQRMYYGDFSDRIHRQALRERIPLDGMFELTLACNLKCHHCYCALDRERKELTTSQIYAILDQIADAGCLWIGFTGGEIFLRQDLADILRYARSKGLLVSLLTNATLIDRRAIGFLKEYRPLQIEITLYAITEETNALVTGVAGMLEKTLSAIKLLKESNIPFDLKTTVTKDNLKELDEIKGFAHDLNVNYRFDAQLHGRINGSKEPWEYRLSPREVVALDLKDEERLKDWHRYCSEFWGAVNYETFFYCSSLRDHFHIDAYGRLLACVISRKHSADILKDSFKVSWEKLYAEVYGIKPKQDFACRGCELGHLCDHCPGWAEMENNDWNIKSDYLCSLAHLRRDHFAALGMLNSFKGGKGNEEKIRISSDS